LNEALKQGHGRTGLTAGAGRLRGAFIVAQMALAVVLLIGAGLLIQTVFRLRNQYSAFQPEKVLTLRTALANYKYGDHSKRVAFYDHVLEKVSALPGVTAVGYTTSVPLQWKGGANGFTIENRPPEPGVFTNAIHRQVSADYMRTLGIPLKQGRYFEKSDTVQSMPVMMINETMARQFWPNGDALGKRVKLGSKDRPWCTIVGIAADVRQMGMDVPVKAEMYFPYSQIKSHFWYSPRDLVIRTSTDPSSLTPAVRAVIHEVDPDQPVSNVATFSELLTEETGSRRLGMLLLAAFASLALLLASIGIYGVLSYFVAQQTAEIGVRMALGAQHKNILAMILKKGMILTIAGLVIGLAASFGLTRLMASLLFEVSASDPSTFAVIPIVLVLVSLLACYIPARRATKVDPLVALRYE
jgi:putative ABC transport system permease protein